MNKWLGRGISELANLHEAIEDLRLNITTSELFDRIHHNLRNLPYVHIPWLEVEFGRGHIHVLRDQLLHLFHLIGNLDITTETLRQVEHLLSPLVEGGGDGHTTGVEAFRVVETVGIEEIQQRVDITVEVRIRQSGNRRGWSGGWGGRFAGWVVGEMTTNPDEGGELAEVGKTEKNVGRIFTRERDRPLAILVVNEMFDEE